MLTLEYKLDGTAAQYAAIDEGIRTVQFLRNKCLRAWVDRQPEGKNFEAMSAYTAALAKEYPFAGRLGSQARQASAERAWTAVSRFYNNCQNKVRGKKGYPRFQHDGRSIEYKETAGWRLAPDDGTHIIFSDGLGIGRLRLIGTRMKHFDRKKNKPLRSPIAYDLATIKRVRIIRRADGYFCQFAIAVCRVRLHEETGLERGIDVGLNAYYTDSEGQKVENPRFFRKAERKVAKLQRQVSRKSLRHKQTKKPKVARKHNKYPAGQPVVKQSRQPCPHWHTHPTTGQTRRRQRPHRVVQPVVHQHIPPEPGKPSHNYQQARKQLAKAYLKVQRQREDYACKQASALVSSSDLIAFEDLQIRNLVRNHHLAKAIHDASWGGFLRRVQYYARMQAVPCIPVPPQFTSQDCSGILPDGSRCSERVLKSLSVRTHICPRCGLVIDRDHNSGRLILERAQDLLANQLVSVPLGRRKRPHPA